MNAKTRVINDDKMMHTIISFCPNQYRFLAAVSKSFQHNYLAVHGGETTTSIANALQTVGTAEIWLNETFLRGSWPTSNVVSKYWTINRRREMLALRLTPCDFAAKYGTLTVLKYLRSTKGCDWSSKTCEAAARHGDLEMLKWLAQSNCPWGVTSYFARGGVLKWAKENGCPGWSNFLTNYHGSSISPSEEFENHRALQRDWELWVAE